MKEPFRLSYRPALDGLRAIAVLLVMARHTDLILPGTRPLLMGGWIGVDVFFVLSGFLITSLLLEERHDTGRISVTRFYLRRAVRLLPALYVVIGTTLAYTTITGIDAERTVTGAVMAVCYVTNMGGSLLGVGGGLLGHTWSLSIEEQYYLIWPAILILILRTGDARHVALASVIVAAAISVDRALVFASGVQMGALFVRTDTRADALLIGSCLAAIVCTRAIPFGNSALRHAGASALVALAVLALTADPWSDAALYLGGLTAIAVLSAILILYLLAFPPELLTCTPAVHLGRVSYGLYLWHFPLFSAVGALALPAPLAITFAVAASLLAASLSHQYLETPITRRYRGRHSQPTMAR